MKLRVTASVCILAAIVAAGLWDLQHSSAQVAAGAAPVQAAATDVFISAPGQPVPPPAGVLPGQPMPAPTDVPGLSPLQPKIFTFQDGGQHQGGNAVYGVGKKFIHLTKRGNHQADALRQAAAALRDAKDDAAKTAAQGQLTELLDKVFEEDMQRREQELAQVEQRTKDLRALMGRRREKKNEIVQLQIKVLLNEADGLGVFNESPMPMPVPYNPVGVKHFSTSSWNTVTPSDPGLTTEPLKSTPTTATIAPSR